MKIKLLLVLGVTMGTTTFISAQPPANDHPQGPPGGEEMVRHISDKLEKELKLNSDQKEKLAAAYRIFFKDMDEFLLRESKGNQPPPPPPPPPPASREAAEKLGKARDAQIKRILNAGQFARYTVLERTLRPPAPENKLAAPRLPPNERKE